MTAKACFMYKMTNLINGIKITDSTDGIRYLVVRMTIQNFLKRQAISMTFGQKNFLTFNSTKIYTVKATVKKRLPFSMPENSVIRVKKQVWTNSA